MFDYDPTRSGEAPKRLLEGFRELQHSGGIFSERSEIDELGSLTSGKKPARQSEGEITVCDLTGTGGQDTAIATLALTPARESGLGTDIGV